MERGQITSIPKLPQKTIDEAIHLYYFEGKKQTEIQKILKLRSSRVVAELLRRDMISRIKEYRKVDKNSTDYDKKTQDIIYFLKAHRKLSYTQIATALFMPVDEVYSIAANSIEGLRNSLSDKERRERNEEMVRMSKEDGLSVTEIGQKMGLSKQMVSRIFASIGYKPIRGTRNLKINSKTLPELMDFVKADCNAKLQEVTDKLREQKVKYTSLKQYTSRTMVELRCELVQEQSSHLTVLNYKSFKNNSVTIKTLYRKARETENKPSYYPILVGTMRLILNTERRKEFKELKNIMESCGCQ